jgi:peptidoglycan/LPS O-acetylase OafA/YrhL
MLGDLVADWLINGGKKPERERLLLFLGVAIFGLVLIVILLLQNRQAPIAAWPDGSYYGLLFGTFTAIPGLPAGAVHFVRYKAERPLSLACAVVSCASLLVSFWLFSQ